MLPLFKNSLPGLFDEFFGNTVPGVFNHNFFGINNPAVNIVDGTNDYRIEVAAPGLEKGDFKIHLENNVLTVSSEKGNSKEEKNEKYMRKEFSYSSFRRNFALPEGIELEKISATHEKGVLNITIPKKEDVKVKPLREIEIA